jgi:hypothetical protein
VAAWFGDSSALELPTAALGSCWFRINGPGVDVGGGDWYTSSLAGSSERRHVYKILVPHGAALPLTLDIASAGSFAGGHPDIIGAGVSDPTRVRVLHPDGSVLSEQTTDGSVPDLTAMLPVVGTYTVTVELGATALGMTPAADRDDDRNAYRLRVTPDGSSTPADTTDDVGIGFLQSSLVCQSSESQLDLATVIPQTAITSAFRNFNAEGAGSVSYTLAPAAPFPGTISSAGVWNGSSGSVDSGEDSPGGGPGYWTWSLVTVPSGQQLIVEVQAGGSRVPTYFNAGTPLPRVGLVDIMAPPPPPDAFIGVPRSVPLAAINLGPVSDEVTLSVPAADSGLSAAVVDFMGMPASTITLEPLTPGMPIGLGVTVAMTVTPGSMLNATVEACSVNQTRTSRGGACRTALVPVLALAAPTITSPAEMATVELAFTATGQAPVGALVQFSVDMGPQQAAGIDITGAWSALIAGLSEGPHAIDFSFSTPGGAFTTIRLNVLAAASPPDAGPPDAGPPPADAGSPDAGPPSMDGGMVEPDAGPPAMDGGMVEPDAGPPDMDGGMVEPDAGPPSMDGGTPNADAGMLAPPTFQSPAPGSAHFTLPRIAGLAQGAQSVTVLLDDVALPEALVDSSGAWEAKVPETRTVELGEHGLVAIARAVDGRSSTSQPVVFFLAIEQPGADPNNTTGSRPRIGLSGGACSGGACAGGGAGPLAAGSPMWLLVVGLWLARLVHRRRARREGRAR